MFLFIYDQAGTLDIFYSIIRLYKISSSKYTMVHLHDISSIDLSLNYSLIFTGTSEDAVNWHQTWRLLKIIPSYVIAVVDQWVNLSTRFLNLSKHFYPDVILAPDNRVKEHYKYLNSLCKIESIGHIRLSESYICSNSKNTVSQLDYNQVPMIFIDEPIILDQSPNKYFYRDVLHEMIFISSSKNQPMYIKLHPRRNSDYSSFIEQYGISSRENVIFSENNYLSLLNTRWIAFGFTSVLLLNLYIHGSEVVILESDFYKTSFTSFYPEYFKPVQISNLRKLILSDSLSSKKSNFIEDIFNVNIVNDLNQFIIKFGCTQ